MPRVEYLGMEFENAYIYKRCEIPLKNQGLVLIRGWNADDGGFLGAGKSSIFEVFSQLQVGKGGKGEVRGGGLKDDMINNFVGTDFRAKLSLTVDGRPYDIIQYRRHREHGNKVLIVDVETGENLLPRDSAKAPQKWIKESLLGIDDVTFFNLVYLAQEFNNVMISGSESDRRKQLTLMFNLHVYDLLYDRTKRLLDSKLVDAADFDALQAELNDITCRLGELPDLKGMEDQLNAAKSELTALTKSVEADMAEYTELTNIHAGAQLRRDLIIEIRKLFSKAKFPPESVTKPQDVTLPYVAELKRAYDNLYAEHTTANTALENVRRKEALEEELKKLIGRDADAVQEELTDVKSKLRTLTSTELVQAEEKVEIASDLQRLGKPEATPSVLEDLHTKAIQAETDLKNRITTIHDAISNEVCPTCHRPFNISADDLRKKEGLLSALRIELEQATQRVHELKRKKEHALKYSRLMERYKKLASVRSPEEVQLDVSRLTKKERDLTQELEQANRRLTLQGELKGLPTEDESDLALRVASLKLRLEAAGTRYNTAKEISDRIQQVVKLPSGNLEEMASRLKTLKDRLDNAAPLLSEANRKVSEVSSGVDEHRRLSRRKTVLLDTLTKREALVKEVACLRALKQVFNPQGLKQDRFHSLLTDATSRTVPMYSNILWPNQTVTLGLTDKEGSIQFQLERGEGVATASSLISGGERHKAGLAFLFGMRDLKELYTGCSTNLLIVDEPFGSLDPQGTESLISIFELLKRRFDTIFVISHRPEVLANPVWDQIWWAVRDGNDATLYRGQPPSRYVNAANELVKH